MSEDKRIVGERAVEFVADGQVVGLGTGSTADYFVRALGALVADGMHIRGVPTSVQTAKLAKEVGIELVTLDDVDGIDVTVDGADEIDGGLRLIKGGGGALLHEKIIAKASNKIVTIADGSKLVGTLGAFPLPVEINDFAPKTAARDVKAVLEATGCQNSHIMLRQKGDGTPFVTDGGHLILDCACEAILDPDGLAVALNQLPTVVEHGLFIGLSSMALLGEGGSVRQITAG